MTSIQQQRAVRLVVGLLVASIATGVSFVVLTLVTHAATLGTNQILTFLVAILYVWVIRKLRAGSSSAYRRVRFVSAAGFVAVGWQLAAGAYPVWLRPIEAGQLVLLAALIVAVNRPVMRAAFPRVPDPRPRNRRAALVLAVLAPVVAEATLGTVPLRMFWALLVFAPIYAGGVLFLREVWRRTGGGYLNLLLLGVAYGLVEEGLALQSLTSPHLYGAAGWAPRLFGVNTDYTELNLVYHAVFSVTIPVVLVELLFRRHGARPYLRRRGLIASGVIALLGAALIRLAVPPSEDPGYTMPPAAIAIVAALAIAFLVPACASDHAHRIAQRGTARRPGLRRPGLRRPGLRRPGRRPNRRRPSRRWGGWPLGGLRRPGWRRARRSSRSARPWPPSPSSPCSGRSAMPRGTAGGRCCRWPAPR